MKSTAVQLFGTDAMIRPVANSVRSYARRNSLQGNRPIGLGRSTRSNC